jgi:hypothetical protein
MKFEHDDPEQLVHHQLIYKNDVFNRLVEMGLMVESESSGGKWEVDEAIIRQIWATAELVYCSVIGNRALAELTDLMREVDWPRRWLVDCVFGNPFRPAMIDSAWLSWNNGAVRRIAQIIYKERAFHDLPILGDALEEAGCTNPDILTHLRGPGHHVLGCWPLDLLRQSVPEV